jgi:hypothetical protein
MRDTIKISVDGKLKELPAKELNLLFHKDVFDVRAPECFEINPENTLEEIRNISQEAWTHISTGEIFQHLFRLVYPLPDAKNHSAPNVEVPIPEQLADLRKMDMGVRHVAGLIILALTKGGIEGKQLFFKLPESYLHPAYAANLADVFIVLPKILTFLQTDPPPAPKILTAMERWLG